jgi:hypothetical protein
MLAVVAAGLVWLWRGVLRPGIRRRIAKEAE